MNKTNIANDHTFYFTSIFKQKLLNDDMSLYGIIDYILKNNYLFNSC